MSGEEREEAEARNEAFALVPEYVAEKAGEEASSEAYLDYMHAHSRAALDEVRADAQVAADAAYEKAFNEAKKKAELVAVKSPNKSQRNRQ